MVKVITIFNYVSGRLVGLVEKDNNHCFSQTEVEEVKGTFDSYCDDYNNGEGVSDADDIDEFANYHNERSYLKIRSISYERIELK